ncbi:UNVERIFIED_CONTAM: nAChRbeta1 [Trichonephila clavipes]
MGVKQNNEKDFKVEIRKTWMDYQLVWDPADYGGINVLRLPPDKVWKPDIVLFNKLYVEFPLTKPVNLSQVPNFVMEFKNSTTFGGQMFLQNYVAHKILYRIPKKKICGVLKVGGL